MVGQTQHRFSRRQLILAALLVVLSCSAAEIVTRAGWVDTFERGYYDLWHNLAAVRGEPKHVMIVAIDNETLLDHQGEPLVFWGPHFARVIALLRRAGARVIGLDYLFRTSAESWLRSLDLTESETSRTYDIPMRAELAAGKVVLTATLAEGDNGEGELLLPIDDYVFVLPGGTKDVGLTNFWTDSDGMVRRFVPALFNDGSTPSLTFATLLAVRSAGLNPDQAMWVMAGQKIHNRVQPRMIGFVGPPGTIPRISFGRFLTAGEENRPGLHSVRNKIIIIASEHAGMQDTHLTPYAQGFLGFGGHVMTGAELHANIVETLLEGRSPRAVPWWTRLLYVSGVILLTTVVFFRLHPWQGLAMGVVAALACATVAYLLFRANWVLPVASAHMGLVIGYLGALGLKLTGKERERQELQRMFGRYVSTEVVEKLLATRHRPDLGGEALRVTILFADIRDFTRISEQLTPHQVVEMLNAYLSRVCDPILEQGGTVDKFIGDAVMAVFGSPAPLANHARCAVRAALRVAEEARVFQTWVDERFRGLGLPPFRIGIGLHTGRAVIGSIGSSKRTDFTAIGDTVNTASRLEGLTKELGWTIAASEATAAEAGPDVLTGRHKRLLLRGRVQPVEAFEVIGLKSQTGDAS